MLWFKNKVDKLVSEISAKDTAFLLTSASEVNKEKRSRAKAQTALNCLDSHSSFKNYIFEFFLKERSEKLRCVALSNVSNEIREHYYGRAVVPGSQIINAYKLKKLNFVIDNGKEPGRRGEFLEKTGVRASLLIPVEGSGVLVVNKTNTEKFADYEVDLLKNFVEYVLKSSLNLALDNEKNFNAAIRDSMTVLYNKGYFLFQLERELDNARRDKFPVSLIMIDVDYFKFYNDMHGHPMGDKVLINVANVLKNNTRRGDIVARYGGEEFVIVLHNAGTKIAKEKAERLRQAVSSFRFYKEELQPNRDLTISLGVASFPNDAKEGKDLIENADKALYYSKGHGKNRVSIFKEIN